MRSIQFDPIDDAATRELAVPESTMDGREKREDLLRLRAALESLPSKYRPTLKAHFVEILPIREIARHDGVPEGTVLSRIFKAKELLREAWDAEGKTQFIQERGSVSLDVDQQESPGADTPEPFTPSH